MQSKYSVVIKYAKISTGIFSVNLWSTREKIIALLCFEKTFKKDGLLFNTFIVFWENTFVYFK